MSTAPPRTLRRLRTLRTLAAGAVALSAVLAGCATPSTSPTPVSSATESVPDGAADPGTASPTPDPAASPQPAPDPAAPPPAATGITITSGGSAYGSMLFDGSRQAIYIWEVETSSQARCYGDCAVAWPPVLTDGAPVAAGEVSAALLGTTTRSDGTTQVTYNGHPLYYYAHEAPGEVKCHDVATHGGLWWVVQPNGNRAA